MDSEKFVNTNDVVKGDTIMFTEGVFNGSYRNPKYIGERTIIAKVIKESYGVEKQQHTFTLEVIEASGTDEEEVLQKKTIMRKGRNIYRNGVKRKLWDDETARLDLAEEKHERGEIARALRRGYGENFWE